MSDQEIRFLFRCRRCGQIDASVGTTNDTLAQQSVIAASLGQRLEGEPMSPDLHASHHCADGGRGISDLVGHSAPGEKPPYLHADPPPWEEVTYDSNP